MTEAAPKTETVEARLAALEAKYEAMVRWCHKAQEFINHAARVVRELRDQPPVRGR